MNLDWHWDEESGAYFDYYFDENGCLAVVFISYLTLLGRKKFVKRLGYPSFCPLTLKLLDHSSSKIQSLANVLFKKDLLWSPFGIRSLSAKDSLFGTKEDYWRGAIWMNMNFLFLDSLKHYGFEEQHKELSTSILNNLVLQWEKTGTLWEQYDSQTGTGRRNGAFTGWTSLVALFI
jgi:mannosyl-oligosaccharide glucosidase